MFVFRVLNTYNDLRFNKRYTKVTKYELLVDNKEMTLLIWGDDVKQDVFERWSQGLLKRFDRFG